jgi:hypothetical protein
MMSDVKQVTSEAGFGSFVRGNPGLMVAGGVAFGVLAGALLPKATKSRFGQRTIAAAASAGEAGLILTRQVRDKAGAAAQEGAAKLGDGTSHIRRRAARAAGSTSASGLDLARGAIDLISALRRR